MPALFLKNSSLKKSFLTTARNFSRPDKELALAIRNIFGFSPKNIRLFSLALRHRSAAQEISAGVKSSNERLEYLGDAVLGLAIADFLFHRYPLRDEGFLTQMRSKFVSRVHLNKLAQKLGLDKLIEVDEDASGISRSMNGDALEAIIGAIYLDRGYEFSRKIILERIVKFHIDLEELENKELNFKSKLIEWSQKEKKALEFAVLKQTGAGHNKFYSVEAKVNGKKIGTGRGYSIKEAEQSAAENAWILLEFTDTE